MAKDFVENGCKVYQVKVRAIAKTSGGTKYGKYSKIKTVKIKKK